MTTQEVLALAKATAIGVIVLLVFCVVTDTPPFAVMAALAYGNTIGQWARAIEKDNK